jgi:hypothetical protein
MIPGDRAEEPDRARRDALWAAHSCPLGTNAAAALSKEFFKKFRRSGGCMVVTFYVLQSSGLFAGCGQYFHRFNDLTT